MTLLLSFEYQKKNKLVFNFYTKAHQFSMITECPYRYRYITFENKIVQELIWFSFYREINI